MRQAEVAANVLLGVLAFLEADDHDATSADPGQAADYGRVVAAEPVAVQLDEIVGHELDQLESVGPLEVAGLLDVSPDGVGGIERLRFVVRSAEKSVNHLRSPHETFRLRRKWTRRWHPG